MNPLKIFVKNSAKPFLKISMLCMISSSCYSLYKCKQQEEILEEHVYGKVLSNYHKEHLINHNSRKKIYKKIRLFDDKIKKKISDYNEEKYDCNKYSTILRCNKNDVFDNNILISECDIMKYFIQFSNKNNKYPIKLGYEEYYHRTGKKIGKYPLVHGGGDKYEKLPMCKIFLDNSN